MLTGILIVLVALVALLAIPVTLDFRLDWPERRNSDVRVEWAFGLVKVRVSESDDEDDHADATEDKRAARASRKRQPGNVAAALRDKRFRQRSLRFARELWRAVRKDDLFIDVRLGLGDPADTGQLWAWLGPLAAFLKFSGDARVGLLPDFQRQRFDVDSGGRIRVIPVRIIGLALGLAVSPAFWRGMRLARRRS